MSLQALVIHPEDNVANLVGPGQKGQTASCRIEGNDAEGPVEVELPDAIPSNHKFAFVDIEAGKPIIKYGMAIGTASKPIRRGEHVHAHNVDSNRGRGDLGSG